MPRSLLNAQAFYDNVIFTPFVFMENDADLMGAASPTETVGMHNGRSTPTFSSAISSSRAAGKIDVYHMITRNLLDAQRIHFERDIPSESPFSASGTSGAIDLGALHRTFTRAPTIHVSSHPRRKNSATNILYPTPANSAPMEDGLALKVTKVGLLNRKGGFLI